MSGALDPGNFRRVMGLFATGVTVVANQTGQEIHAMTANAVTSLSLDPLLVLVCIAKRAHMAELLVEGVGFSINILRGEQQALSNYFSGRWDRKPPPFRFVPWQGRPRLEGCLASLGCTCYQTVDGGDHWIVIGRVVALHQGIEPFQPLLFFKGQYSQLTLSEGEPAPDLGWVETPVLVYYDPWNYEQE